MNLPMIVDKWSKSFFVSLFALIGNEKYEIE